MSSATIAQSVKCISHHEPGEVLKLIIKGVARPLLSIVVTVFACSVWATPISSIVSNPAVASVDSPISFDGSLSFDTDLHRSIVLYEWDFDFNSFLFLADVTSLDAQIVHSFSIDGIHLTALRVTNDGVQPESAISTISTTVTAVDVSPIPEPSIVVLFGSGLTWLGAIAWRRNRRPLSRTDTHLRLLNVQAKNPDNSMLPGVSLGVTRL